MLLPTLHSVLFSSGVLFYQTPLTPGVIGDIWVELSLITRHFIGGVGTGLSDEFRVP